MSYSKVILEGFVGTVDEIKEYGEGKFLINFTVATQNRKNKDDPHWHQLVAFGKTAEFIRKNIKKGDSIIVDGELVYEKFTPKGTENEVKVAKITVDSVQWSGRKVKAD